MNTTQSKNGIVWIKSVGANINGINKQLQTAINSEFITSIDSDCRCMYDAFSQECSDKAESRYRFFVSVRTKAGETAIIWTKDVSIKNGESSAVRTEFLARIESFKQVVLDEVFRILEKRKHDSSRLDFYTELNTLEF